MRQLRLEDGLDALIDHRGKTPLKLGSSFTEVGIPVVSAIMVKDGRIDFSQCRYVSEDLAKKWMPVPTQRGDVLMTSEAPLGRVARVPSDDALVLGQRIFALRGRPGVLDSGFLYFALQSSSAQSQLVGRGTGTTVVGIRQSALRELTINIPDFDDQVAIAAVLGALDDKIAANSAVAQTSDDLVRAMFDHVSSKQATTVRIDTLVSNVRQMFSPGGSEHQIYIGLEHLPRRLMWCTQTGTSAEVSSTKAVFLEGDILFGKLRPYFHKVVSAPAEGVCSTDILVCRPQKVDLAGFALAALTSDAVVARCSAAAEGTRMPRASWADLAACEIGWPGLDGAAALSNTVLALRAAVQAYLRENQTLAKLRDTLLPALMSGRLRVKDAERQVEDAV